MVEFVALPRGPESTKNLLREGYGYFVGQHILKCFAGSDSRYLFPIPMFSSAFIKY